MKANTAIILNNKLKKWICFDCILIAFIFGFSVILRYLISDFTKTIYIYPDELRYYMIAESIIDGRGITIYNGYTDFQKILYSLCIAPAFLFDDTIIQIKIISLINAIVMSSGIFPVYFLAKKILNNKRMIIISLQTVDKVGAGIIPSTTFLYIAILLPKILISSRIPVF